MNKERILIFGGGQIGNFYSAHFQGQNIPVKIAKADITHIGQIKRAITLFKPTVIINTAAKTNLEWCAEHKEEAFRVNVLGADNLASVCDSRRIYLIHFSSGCIFQSEDAHDAKREDDRPNPAAYYSLTKVWAEQMIQFERSRHFRCLILRPRQPVSAQFNYKNMLVKMLTFAKFVDTPNTATVLEDLMDWTSVFVVKKPVGVLHAANPGYSTPYRIGLLLKERVLSRLPVQKIAKSELDAILPNRRVDTILNIDKLKKMDVRLRPLEERLPEIIDSLRENIRQAKPAVIKEQLDKTLAQSRARTVVNRCWPNLLRSLPRYKGLTHIAL